MNDPRDFMARAIMSGRPNPMQIPLTKDEELDVLRRQVEIGAQFLREIEEAPLPFATVVAVLPGGKKALLMFGGGLLEQRIPTKFAEKLGPGDRVHLDPNSHGIIDLVEKPVAYGHVHTVTEVLDDRHALVDDGPMGGGRCILYGEPPAIGDRVVLDPTGTVIMRNYGPPKPTHRESLDTGVSWDDVGGLSEPKAKMREAIEGYVKDAARYTRYGRRRPRGVLLSGPPGVGKTYLMKAAATAMAALHGKAWAPTGFILVSGPTLLNKFVGESERAVRALFEDARMHFAAHGYPATIGMDEADGLLCKRGSSRFEGMERTMVPQFLAEMDGMREASAFVIVSTNRPDQLDPAILRDGRLDLKVAIGRPTREDAEEIAAVHVRRKPLEGLDEPAAAAAVADELFDPRHVLYMLRSKSGKDRKFTLGSLASGAAVAGLVSRAVALAMGRERESGLDGGVRSGDIRAAGDQMRAEQLALDHSADLEPVLAEMGSDLRAVEKSR